MSQPVTIENEFLKLDVWPQFGGKVSSIVDKADNYELLFTYPAELPTRCQYGTAYRDGWYVGWDECFPAISAGAYPLHPYEGIANPDHGELWPLPTTAVPTRDGITTVWHGLRFGYRLTRKLYLSESSIISEYTLINLAPFEFRFCWALHGLLSSASPAQIDVGGPLALHGGGHWPALDARQSFDRTDRLPDGGAWKVISEAPISRPITAIYPERKRALRVEYASAPHPAGTVPGNGGGSTAKNVPGYWGIWNNTGGWEGHHHFAIEPMTGRSDSLQACIEDDSAGRVAPMGRAEWRATLTVIAAP